MMKNVTIISKQMIDEQQNRCLDLNQISYKNMAQFFQYTKSRKEFGRPPQFADTIPMTTAFNPHQGDRIKDQDYVKRNPNFIELSNICELSLHQVNTLRVSTGDKGNVHREGGWPESIDPTEQQQYARFMKKIDKDQVFAAQVKSLCQIAEIAMAKNNQIDMFEEYFVNEVSDHIVENISTKTLMLLKDPPDICKRAVSELSWHCDGPSKIAVSYAIPRFQQTPEKMRTCAYVWDIQNPNAPELTLNSPSPLSNIQFNQKMTDIIGGGCSNGIVGIWDFRKGKEPAALTHVQKSHSDPVTHFQWLMSKTGHQCVSVSTDGKAYFWDTRKLKEDRIQELLVTDLSPQGKELVVGATTLQNNPEASTKFLIGTEQGSIIVANKKTRRPIEIMSRLGNDNKHLGPIYSISRNLQFTKVFMSIGDWSAKIWMDDSKTPIIKTRYHANYLSDGCFSPVRPGAFFLTRKDGWMDVWDFYYRQNEIAFSHKVSEAPLTSIKVSYTGASGSQVAGGKYAAIGDLDGTVTILELCQSLYTLQKNEKDIMQDIFQREANKEKNLEALRRMQELDKKRVPKDMAAIQAKLQEKIKSELELVDERFKKLIGQGTKNPGEAQAGQDQYKGNMQKQEGLDMEDDKPNEDVKPDGQGQGTGYKETPENAE